MERPMSVPVPAPSVASSWPEVSLLGVAVVVLTAGQEAGPTLEREIRDFCNQKLAAYKWVRRVKFVEALPKTISGKIRRHTLRVP